MEGALIDDKDARSLEENINARPSTNWARFVFTKNVKGTESNRNCNNFVVHKRFVNSFESK